MRTYDLIDRVTEAELLAVTTAGARRWLERNGWTYDDSSPMGLWFHANAFGVLVCVAHDGSPQFAGRMAATLNRVSDHTGRPPRAILDEMTTDSRIVAEIGRVTTKAGLAALAAKENER